MKLLALILTLCSYQSFSQIKVMNSVTGSLKFYLMDVIVPEGLPGSHVFRYKESVDGNTVLALTVTESLNHIIVFKTARDGSKYWVLEKESFTALTDKSGIFANDELCIVSTNGDAKLVLYFKSQNDLIWDVNLCKKFSIDPFNP